MSTIRVTPDEFNVLVDAVMTYYECKKEDWHKYEIHDKRHNKEDRKKHLAYIYNDALRCSLLAMLVGEAKIIDMKDEDSPWVSNDFENLWNITPLSHVRWLANEAGLSDYLNELEEGYGD